MQNHVQWGQGWQSNLLLSLNLSASQRTTQETKLYTYKDIMFTKMLFLWEVTSKFYTLWITLNCSMFKIVSIQTTDYSIKSHSLRVCFRNQNARYANRSSSLNLSNLKQYRAPVLPQHLHQPQRCGHCHVKPLDVASLLTRHPVHQTSVPLPWRVNESRT